MTTTKTTRQPKYRKHKSSGQAVVTLNGRDHYLGKHGSAASRRAYDRLIAEWLANGRQIATTAPRTVQDVIAAYLKHAERHYRRADGTQTNEVREMRYALRPVRHLYGTLPAIEFGPLKLKAVRQLMVTGYDHPKYGPQGALSRSLVNQRVQKIKRVFRWATAEELVPGSVFEALRAVEGLKLGRSEAREAEPIRPVADDTINTTIPHLSRRVAAMVTLQRLTGARPGEICALRVGEIARTDAVWVARLDMHKTAHRAHIRELYIGPRAQSVLLPFLEGKEADAFVFSPAEAVAEQREALKATRTKPRYPSQAKKPKRRPKWRPGKRYTTISYRRAIAQACEKAFPAPDGLDADAVKAWNADHSWHPHQLRHTAATHIRREFGVELARVVLGHKNAFTTEIYAEADRAKAVQAVAMVG